MNVLRTLSLGTAASASLLLLACGAVGKGNFPQSASLRLQGGTVDITSSKTFICLPQSLDMILTFSNQERGSYGASARWSSSNTAVAEVSNGDIPVPDGSGNFYGRGVVVPKGNGTAVITAKYLNFSNDLTITIGTITNARLEPTELNLAPATFGSMRLLGDLDGVATTLPATWAFVAPNEATATIVAATGVVSAKAAGSALSARASLAGCDIAKEGAVSVSALQSIALTKEFASSSQLVVGTTEFVRATGTLANGKTQDLTAQSTYTTSDASALSPLFLSPGHMVALKANAAPLTLTVSQGSPAVTSPALSIQPVDATLSKLTLSPASKTIAAGATANFTVQGEYSNGLTQPITRHVNYLSSDTAIAVVASNALLAPQAGNAVNTLAGLVGVASTATAGATVTITASHPSLTASSAAVVTVGP